MPDHLRDHQRDRVADAGHGHDIDDQADCDQQHGSHDHVGRAQGQRVQDRLFGPILFGVNQEATTQAAMAKTRSVGRRVAGDQAGRSG